MRNSDVFIGKRIFSLVSSVLEYNNYVYLIFTTPGDTSNTESGEYYAIKKFSLTDFDLENYDNSKPIEQQSKFGDRVITGFIMEDENGEKVIVINYLRTYEEDGEIRAQYSIRFYILDLEIIGDDLHNFDARMRKNIDIIENYGIFSKPILLKDQTPLFIFYFVENGVSKLVFHFFSFKRNLEGFYTDWTENFYDEFKHRFDNDIVLNDVHKISDDRVAIITTRNSGTSLFIIILDFFGSYIQHKYRLYHYKIFQNYRIKKELVIYSHQNFLILSSTIGPINTEQPYSSILLFFSYPNGTDFQIDISPYLQGSDNYDNTQNLFNYLMTTLKLENNIFRLEIVQKIKLTTIPEEILFYNGIDDTPLTDGSFIDSNYVLKENTNKIKTSTNYYHLYYQFVAKEPSYKELYLSDIEIYRNDDYSNLYIPKEYYGRTNKLSFKLCHDYCKNCYSLGTSNDNQHCASCLPEYSYDYLANKNDFIENCVPSGEMYDKELHKLLKCQDYPHKFYLNSSESNKKYCFKFSYDCPDAYPNLNTDINECYYTPPPPPPTPTSEKVPSTIKEKETTNIPEDVDSPAPSTNKEKEATTIPKVIASTIPKRIPPTFSQNEMSTIIETSPTIINNCSYYTFEINCIFTNLTNQQILDKLKQELISTYPKNGMSILVNASDSYSFQVTNTINEEILLIIM